MACESGRAGERACKLVSWSWYSRIFPSMCCFFAAAVSTSFRSVAAVSRRSFSTVCSARLSFSSEDRSFLSFRIVSSALVYFVAAKISSNFFLSTAPSLRGLLGRKEA